jgi:hypothetical protein
MRYLYQLLIIFFYTLPILGCAPNSVSIREYRITVTRISDSAAEQIERELNHSGYIVRREESEESRSPLGSDRTSDITFVMHDQGLTEYDVKKVTSRLMNMQLKDTIDLKRTIVEQQYASASAIIMAVVELRIDVTENASAYYKDTGMPVKLQRLEGQQSATFLYDRKKGEEYVDIYIVPDDAPPDFKPKTFLRVSLFSPFKSQHLPWEPWYKKIRDSIPSPLGKKE